MDKDKIRELKKIEFIESKEVKDRTETDHFYLIRFKHNRSVRDYLLSMGAFEEENKGCGKIFHNDYGSFRCGAIEDLKHSDSILLCEDCKLSNTKE